MKNKKLLIETVRKSINELLVEAWNNHQRLLLENYEGYVNVGVVKDGNPSISGGDAYVFVNLNAPEHRRVVFFPTPEPTDFYREIRGLTTSSDIELFPKYKNTEYDYAINGKPPTEEENMEKLKKHKELMSKLNVKNGMVILRHDSSVAIKDGYIRPNKPPNHYTPNGSLGSSYFWASEQIGNDQSNNQKYRYYCEVPIEQVYDRQNNPLNFKNTQEAFDNGYKVFVQTWKGGDAVVATTKFALPISFAV